MRKQKVFLTISTRSTLKHSQNRALSSFNKNKERDLAIIALLLASGVRLSEAVNLDLRDLNLKMMVIDVTRKGGKRDSVNVAAFAKPYLEQYLAIRDKRYKTEKTDTALFLNLVPRCFQTGLMLLVLKRWWPSIQKTLKSA